MIFRKSPKKLDLGNGVEDFFDTPPDYPFADGMITADTLPYAARTAVEFLHDEKPHAVFAADRGGRPLAIATMASWRHRYPGHRFPTLDHKIHFSRLSGKEITTQTYFDLVKNSMVRAGIITRDGDGDSPLVQIMAEVSV